MAIFKPAKPLGLASIQIKIPASQVKRLQDVQQGAAQMGLVLDVDAPLGKALARLLRAAEAELGKLPSTKGSGSLEGQPAGAALAVDNLQVTASPLQSFGCKEN